ncbi:unnamed protein product [Jaminaea pallidilutea]
MASADPSGSAAASSSSLQPGDAPSSRGQSRILWSKSRVTLHPSPYTKDNEPGFLSLLQVRRSTDDDASATRRPSLASDVFLTWIPEDVVKGRGQVAQFVEVELREAEGLRDQVTLVGSPRSVASSPAAQDTVVIDHLPPSTQDGEPGFSSSAFSHRLGDVYSVRITPPTASNWYGSLSISLVGGRTLPSLFFHDDESRSTILGMLRASQGESYPPPAATSPTWGGEELIQQLRKYSFVHRSVHDHQTFLLNPTAADLETHSTLTFADDALDIPASAGQGEANDHAGFDRAFPDDPFAPTYNSAVRRGSPLPHDSESLSVWAKTTRMSLLSSFSHVTRTARDASRQLREHPVVSALDSASHRGAAKQKTGKGAAAAGQSNAQAGPLGPFGSRAATSDVVEKAGVAEYDSARVYLAKWARLVEEEGERNRKKEDGGGAKSKQGKVGDATQTEEGGLGVFELLDHPQGSLRPVRQFDPIKPHEWQQWSSSGQDGRPTIPWAEVKSRVFSRGLAGSTRRQAWRVLLGVSSWSQSSEERRDTDDRRRRGWESLLAISQDETGVIAPAGHADVPGNNAEIRAAASMASSISERDDVQEQRHRIRVDCLRIDRRLPLFNEQHRDTPLASSSGMTQVPDDSSASTNPHIKALGEILLAYTFYDTLFHTMSMQSASSRSQALSAYDLVAEIPPTQLARMAIGKSIRDSELGGYVQGMSDLCSVLYVINDGDPCDTFWCFVGLMERMRSNFLSSQAGMKSQLLALQTLLRTTDRPLYDHLERTASLNFFFCFRWLLVRFKRELEFEGVCRIWEAGFAAEKEDDDDAGDTIGGMGPPAQPSRSQASDASLRTDSFHLFICLAILTSHRSVVLDHLAAFDEVLQYFQGLAGTIDVEETIRQAEVLIKALRAKCREADEAATRGEMGADADSGAAAGDLLAGQALEDLKKLVDIN